MLCARDFRDLIKSCKLVYKTGTLLEIINLLKTLDLNLKTSFLKDSMLYNDLKKDESEKRWRRIKWNEDGRAKRLIKIHLNFFHPSSQ